MFVVSFYLFFFVVYSEFLFFFLGEGSHTVIVVPTYIRLFTLHSFAMHFGLPFIMVPVYVCVGTVFPYVGIFLIPLGFSTQHFSNPYSPNDTTPLYMSCFGDYGAPMFPYVVLGGYPGKT